MKKGTPTALLLGGDIPLFGDFQGGHIGPEPVLEVLEAFKVPF